MNHMQKFREKPVEVDAIQLKSVPGKHGNHVPDWEAIAALFGNKIHPVGNNVGGRFECLGFSIKTFRVSAFAEAGDWIIQNDKGELCARKPSIFNEAYEAI